MNPVDLAARLAGVPDGPIGVAVSGGGDSVALLLLLHAAAPGRLAAVTVDHGLRPEARTEAEAVAALCAKHGIGHTILCWEGWDGRGNLQDRARQARRRLIANWARARGIASVALGHTLDDQAETVLMRLARGSGVDGLSGIAATTHAEGIVWFRPLLEVRRAALRRWLVKEGVDWAEDPSNSDTRFDRVRARAALPALADLGLGAERLAATARAMGRARTALERAAAALAGTCLEEGGAGDLILAPEPFADASVDVRLRLLATALSWVSGAVYRPRLVRLEATLAAIDAGRVARGLTFHGCVLRSRDGRIAIRRELARMAPAVPLATGRWDGRWALEGKAPGGEHLTIGALGAGGLARVVGRVQGPANEALAASPAIWQNGTLVAAPVARPEPHFSFRRVSAMLPPWATDSALNPPDQRLC